MFTLISYKEHTDTRKQKWQTQEAEVALLSQSGAGKLAQGFRIIIVYGHRIEYRCYKMRYWRSISKFAKR